MITTGELPRLDNAAVNRTREDTCQTDGCHRETQGSPRSPWCCPACRARDRWNMQVVGHSRECNERTSGGRPAT